MDTGQLNDKWAHDLIHILASQNVRYFCCAPGSRNTPLSLAIAHHGNAEWSVHFDERAACFHAVGYAKATKRPAVVMATSGTAIGNLLPAVMEACNEGVPLILLTADRPPELRDCGANQTCDQVKLFQNHVRWQVDLPCPDEWLEQNYLNATIAHAVAMSKSCPAGPVHINCMFREPLFAERGCEGSLKRNIIFSHPDLHPTDTTVNHWAHILSSPKQGVIIAGSDCFDQSDAICALADTLKWPIFADILSPVRRSSVIDHFDPILKLTNLKTNSIIQFGNRFTSKTLASWLQKQTPEFFLHISVHTMRQDPHHLVTHRVHCSPKIFVEKLLTLLPIQEDETWRLQWTHWNALCAKGLSDFFADCKDISEPGIFWELNSYLPDNWALFLANSMPIRDANQFFVPNGCGPIFGNRGVSGIDGNIATAAGIAVGLNKPVLAVLGDLSALHDLTSLSYLSKIKQPVILLVVNNGGGGIFSFLPISKRPEVFEEFVAAKHNITFESAAKMFHIPYVNPQNTADFRTFLSAQKKHPQSCLVEIATDRLHNVFIHEQILTKLAQCLHNSNMETPAYLH